MKISWYDMSRREKILVICGGGLLLVFFFYGLLIQPVRDEYTRLKTEVVAKRGDLEWMRAVATERAGNPVGIRKADSSSLLKRIDRAVRKFGISAGLARVEPVGKSGVKIWFEDVLYTDFMKWLRSLATEGMLSVSSVSVERAEAEGYVTARISLEQR